MKRLFFLLLLVYSGMQLLASELYAQAVDSSATALTDSSSTSSLALSITDSGVSPQHWVSIIVSPYGSFGGPPYSEIPIGVSYNVVLKDHITVGAHVKTAESGYLEIGPRITYTQKAIGIFRHFFWSVTVAPSLVGSVKPLGGIGGINLFRKSRSVRLPLEFGMGYKLSKNLEAVLCRTWAFTPIAFDVGTSLELRYWF